MKSLIRYLELFYLISMAALVNSQTAAFRVTVCATGCTYANTRTGLNTAIGDAVTYQTNTACVPYIIEIDPANVADLNGSAIILPAKTCAQYIRLRSMKLYSLPPDGTRIDPTTQSALLARIQNTMATPSGFFFSTVAGAITEYWAFEGLDLYANSDTAGVNVYSTILLLGETGSNFPSSIDRTLRPHHFIITHNWIHGVEGARNVANGIGLGANNVYIADNVIEDIAVDALIGPTTESHAISGTFFEYDLTVLNSVVSACTENSLIGGAYAPAGLLPTFLNFTGNKYYKRGSCKFQTSIINPTWPCMPGNVNRNTATNHDWQCSAGSAWVDLGGLQAFGNSGVKNTWELKMCRGCKLFGNDLMGFGLPSEQNGEVIVLNLTTQPAAPLWVQPVSLGAQPWTTVEDVDIRANNLHDLIAASSNSYPGGVGSPCLVTPSDAPWCYEQAHNTIRTYSNIISNVSDQRLFDKGQATSGADPASGAGWFALVNSADFNLDYDHNTFILSTNTTDPTVQSGQLYLLTRLGILLNTGNGYINLRNNIFPLGNYGIVQALSPPSLYGPCEFFQSMIAGGTGNYLGNVVTKDRSWSSYPVTLNGSNKSVPCSTAYQWPTLTTQANTGQDVVNGSFVVQAPFTGTAEGGRNPGADLNLNAWATAGALDGTYNAALEYKIRSVVSSASGGNRSVTIKFTAVDTTACTWELSTDPFLYASPVAVTSQTRTGREGSATWTNTLAPGTTYWARSTCASKTLEQDVTGRRVHFVTAP